MQKYVRIGLGKSRQAYSLIASLGYESRCRHSYPGGYVVSIEREDAPAFINLMKENGIKCQYIK